METLKVLFVCHGNICRSTMAEFVMKDKVARAGLARWIYIESAGTSDEELGNPVYPGTRRILARHGINCDGKYARRITKADYARFDYLVGMDGANIRNMRRAWNGDPDGKVSLLLDFTAEPGREIDDPWYTDDFDSTWELVCEACDGLLAELRARLANAQTD